VLQINPGSPKRPALAAEIPADVNTRCSFAKACCRGLPEWNGLARLLRLPVLATLPHLRTSDRIVRDYRHVFVAVVCPGMLAAVPDIGASDQRPRQRAFVNLTLAEGLGPISPPRMPKVASWQLLLRTPDRPMFTLARSRRKRSALSVSVARAVACVPAKAVTKKIFATSNQSVTADDLVNLRLTLNFLPRGPNRST
jgi:hypothetical protein